MRKIVLAVLLMTVTLGVGIKSTFAADTYVAGRISNVTFSGNQIYIMMDSGVPDNCIGTPYGWMEIPAESKITQAFVLGLWMRGDMSQVSVTIYTSGRVGNGYCQITQIDPVG